MVNLGEDDGSVILTGAKNLGLHRAERLFMNDKVQRRFAPTKNQKPAYVTLSLSKGLTVAFAISSANAPWRSSE